MPALAAESALLVADLPPVPAGRMRVRAIASGVDHTCALGDGGRVVCWGDGATGRRGDDGAPPSYAEYLYRGAVDIEAGGGRTCVRFADGARRCWGREASGALSSQRGGSLFPCFQLGLMAHDSGAVLLERPHAAAPDGQGGWRDTSLVQVPSLAGATLAAGTNHYLLAAMSDGSLWCASARPGVFICPGDASDGWSRTRGVAARQLIADSSSFCALRAAGDVVCTVAGLTSPARAVGDGTSLAAVMLPRPATAIAGGAMEVCALLDDQSVWCWDADRQAVSPALRGRPVVGPKGVRAISAGFVHHCALDEEGDVWCWGENHFGALGPGTGPHQTEPRKVRILP